MTASTAQTPRGGRRFVRSAPPGVAGQCSVGEHVDVITGRVFTRPFVDITPPIDRGPLPPFARPHRKDVMRLCLTRVYSSDASERNAGLGFGWAHTWGWGLDVEEDKLVVWTDAGIAVDFPRLDAGQTVIGPWGVCLGRTCEGYHVEPGDGFSRRLVAADETGARHRLEAIEDRNGNRLTLRYEGALLREARGPFGDVAQIATTEQGEIRSITMHGERLALYVYDEHRDLVGVEDAAKAVSTYRYEGHLLTRQTDRAGLAFYFHYDAAGRCVETWGRGAEGAFYAESGAPYLADDSIAKGLGHARIRYADDGWSHVLDTIGERRFFGNAHGLMETRVEGNAEVSARYDARGLVVEQVNELGARTITERDEHGRVAREVDPLGRARTIERDEEGRAVCIVEANGGVTTIDYDARGNAIRVVDPCGGAMLIARDERGRIVKVTAPSGAVTSYRYSRAGRCVEREEPSGGTRRWSYDARGRCVSERSPLGGSRRFEHDSRGDVIAIHELGSMRLDYDGERRLVAVIDGMNRATRMQWGHANKLVQIIDPAGGTLRASYRRDGMPDELINWLDPRERHRRLYDGAGRVREEHAPEGRRVVYQRDRAGRVVGRDEHGCAVKVVRDEAGQVVARTLGSRDGEERFIYDARGDVERASWPGGEIRFERDVMGRVLRELQTLGDETIVVERVLDVSGRLVARSSSLGLVERIERGLDGKRLRTSLDGEAAIEHRHNELGVETERWLPEGGLIRRELDLLTGRCVRRNVLARKSDGAGWTRTHQTRYEQDGDQLGDIWTARTPMQRLKREADGAVITFAGEAFRYDDCGNRHVSALSATHPQSVYGLGGRLLQKGSSSYAWDDAGRLIARRHGDGEDCFTWDDMNRLIVVKLADGRRIEYDYDPFGRRVRASIYDRATEPGAPHVLVEQVRWMWDGDALAHERRTREGEPTTLVAYVFEDDEVSPLAMRRTRLDGGGRAHEMLWSYFVNDAAGTPELLLSGDGNVQTELERQTWGRTYCDPVAEGMTALRFAGQYEDIETGLHYHRFRYYDPDMGLYLSPDPNGCWNGHRPYAYVSDPFEETMPLGIGDGARPFEVDWRARPGDELDAYVCREEPAAGGTSAYGAANALRWFARWRAFADLKREVTR